MDFGGEHGYGGRAGVPWVIELVAAGCHSNSMDLFFLGTDIADKVGVGDDASLGYFLFSDEENCAGAFDAILRGAIATDAVR